MKVTWEVRRKLKYIGEWKVVLPITNDSTIAYLAATILRDYLAHRWWGRLFDWELRGY